MQLDKNRLLKINDEITVKGIINSTAGFTIYFFTWSIGLESIQYIYISVPIILLFYLVGETVLEAKFNQNEVEFDTYYVKFIAILKISKIMKKIRLRIEIERMPIFLLAIWIFFAS